MLDFADFVAINKFDRKGAQDALRDVRKQYQRNREAWKTAPDEMPVFGTMASRFNDDGVTALYQALAAKLKGKGLQLAGRRAASGHDGGSRRRSMRSCPRRACVTWPRSRNRCAGITRGRRRRRRSRASGSSCARRSGCWRLTPQPSPAGGREKSPHPGRLPRSGREKSPHPGPSPAKRERERLRRPLGDIAGASHAATSNKASLSPQAGERVRVRGRSPGADDTLARIDKLIADRDAALDPRASKLLTMWPKTQAAYSGDEYVVKIRDREIRTALTTTSLSGTKVRKVALPTYEDDGEILRWQLTENVPGSFPFAAGRVRVQARERGPYADVRRRRRCVPHQQALSPAGRQHAGQAVCSIRSRCTATIRRCGRTSTARSATPACDRHARRHEGAVLGLRPVRAQ